MAASTHEMHARTRHARAWVWGAIVADHRVVRARRRDRAGRGSAVQRAGERQRHLPAGGRRGDPGDRPAEEVRRTSPRCRSSCSSSLATRSPRSSRRRWRHFVDEVPSLEVETDTDVTAPLSDFLGSAPVTAVPSEDGQAILVTVLLSEDKTTDALPNGESPVLAVAESLSEAASEAADPVGLDSYVTGPGGAAGRPDLGVRRHRRHAAARDRAGRHPDPDPRLPQPVPLGHPAGQRRVRPVAGQRRRLPPGQATSCSLNGQSQGILTVLVFGAGTDYALLMVSRYREELHYYERPVDALKAAWRGTVEPILASGGTASLGLLMLLFSELNSNKSTGPVAAVGIASALVVMLTLLPALLLVPSAALPLGALPRWWSSPASSWSSSSTPRCVPFVLVGGVLAALTLIGLVVGGLWRQFTRPGGRPRLLDVEPVRWAFWPRVPHVDKHDDKLSGTWAKVSRQVGHRPRVVWVGAAPGCWSWRSSRRPCRRPASPPPTCSSTTSTRWPVRRSWPSTSRRGREARPPSSGRPTRCKRW